VSPRPHELEATDFLPLPGSPAVRRRRPGDCGDRGRAATRGREAARDDAGFRDRENTRVRDLVDLVALIEHDLLDPALVARATAKVWAERDGTAPPATLPELPLNWNTRYPQLIPVGTLTAETFPAATALVAELWTEMFPAEEF